MEILFLELKQQYVMSLLSIMIIVILLETGALSLEIIDVILMILMMIITVIVVILILRIILEKMELVRKFAELWAFAMKLLLAIQMEIIVVLVLAQQI